MDLKFFKLSESFDSSYPYKWYSFSTDRGVATFKNSNGLLIKLFIGPINLGPTGRWKYEVDFEGDGTGHQMTNSKDSIKVLATVIKALTEYVNKFSDNIDQVVWSTVKDSIDSPDKRRSVYLKLANKFLDKSKWNLKVADQGRSTTKFTITRT